MFSTRGFTSELFLIVTEDVLETKREVLIYIPCKCSRYHCQLVFNLEGDRIVGIFLLLLEKVSFAANICCLLRMPAI